MSVLKNFENGPRSPGPGATEVLSPEQALNVIFFEFAKRSLAGGGGPVAPHGRQGSPSLYKPWPPFFSHLSPKIAPKIQKKREG